MTVIEKLHEQFPKLNDLRMREIRIDKQMRKVFCTLSYPNDPSFDMAKKSQIVEAIKREVPQGYSCSVKFVIDTFTEVSFKKLLVDTLKNKYPIFSNIGKTKIDVALVGKYITVVFHVNKVVKKNMELADFTKSLLEFFEAFTSYHMDIMLKQDDSATIDSNIEDQEKLVQLAINRELLKPARTFRVSNIKKYIGKEILSAPMYIADLRNPVDSCVICGVVSQKTTRAAKSNPNLYVCSFTLTDGTGKSIPCVSFVRLERTDVNLVMEETGCGEAEARTIAEKRSLKNDKKLKPIFALCDGDQLLVRGKVTLNKQLEMLVYDMSKCDIAPLDTQQEFARGVPKEYLLIKPEHYTEYRQINFVDNAPERSLLTGKNYAVLHVNATGFNVTDDKIYAICAVRVVDGHVSERFFTYINPEMDIDDKTLSQCNVSSDKLMFHPTITEVVSDLYKFVYGYRLVGNNLRQIVDVLNYYAAPVGYHFVNNTVDQTELLSRLFENSIFDANISAAKIEDVAKKCKVTCPSLVFCGDTALTVARCMSVLSNNSK